MMGLVNRLKRFLRPYKPVVTVEKGYPEWASWIEQDRSFWQKSLGQTRKGPKVLIASSVGGFAPGIVMESTLAVSLSLRGAQVKYLLCDNALPGCLKATVSAVPDLSVLENYELKDSLCRNCYPRGAALFESTGLPILKYSELLSDDERRTARELAALIALDDIKSYVWNGLAVGEHALAGTLRFYARGELEGEPGGEMVLRRFLEAALLTTMAVSNLLKREKFDVVVFNHGIYVPHGLTAEVCRRAGVRIVTWNVAYRKQCFIFSHEDTYHHTLLSEPASVWEDMPWGPAQEKEVMDYLASRLTGSRDWIWFHEKPFEDIKKISEECGIDFNKPCIGLLTNVFWDAQLHYRANAFSNMLDWIVQTISYFEKRQDLQLLIRIHPAEVRGTVPSRQPILAEIHKAFPKLPSNVFIIPPESNSSTYAAMYQCDSVVIYGTKTGVELSSVGIPVIVAGEAWIRGKGVTQDANSPAEYFSILDQLPVAKRLDEKTLQRARKYAYHFFYRRMIPLDFVEPAKVSAFYTVNISSIRQLAAGQSRGLDVICDGILKAEPFVYPAEIVEQRQAAA